MEICTSNNYGVRPGMEVDVLGHSFGTAVASALVRELEAGMELGMSHAC